MTAEVEQNPVEPAPAPAPADPARKLTQREKRWRKMFEEILGWIFVPIILIAGYWAVVGGLNAAGTSVSAIVQGVRQLLTGGGQQP
jgi:hypothetical protein